LYKGIECKNALYLIEGGDEEYLLYALNFMTFGIISQKLWPNMLLFFVNGQSGQIKKSLFPKTKI